MHALVLSLIGQILSPWSWQERPATSLPSIIASCHLRRKPYDQLQAHQTAGTCSLAALECRRTWKTRHGPMCMQKVSQMCSSRQPQTSLLQTTRQAPCKSQPACLQACCGVWIGLKPRQQHVMILNRCTMPRHIVLLRDHMPIHLQSQAQLNL